MKASGNLSLKQKLWLALLGLCCLAVVITYLGYVSIKYYSGAFETLYTHNVVAASHLHEAQTALWRLRYGGPDEESRFQETVSDNLRSYADGKRKPEELALLANLNRALGHYTTARSRWLDLRQTGSVDEAAQWRAKEMLPHAAAALEAVEMLVARQYQGAVQAKAELDKTNATASQILFGVILFALCLVSGTGWIISRSVARQLVAVSSHLAGAAAQLEAASAEQEATAAHQASGIEESSRTVVSLLESASHIADTAGAVLANAERTKATTETTSTRIIELNTHANRMGEILEAIREIADRTDLLALNASLEASRAGEEGRSFALLASEMRKLAERVTSSVNDVKLLVGDVRASGSSTVMATEEARKLADGTTESARQITLVTNQQRTATEQVAENMRNISGSLNQALAAAKQTRASASSLREQALELSNIIGIDDKSQRSSRP